jgi:hypothetical protein
MDEFLRSIGGDGFLFPIVELQQPPLNCIPAAHFPSENIENVAECR